MKADYGWVILVIVAILAAVFWKPVMGGINDFQNRNFDQAAFDRGEAIFNDKNAWTPLEDKSCAMCHGADYKHDDGAKITMADYKEGSPVILKNLSKKYKNDLLTNEDALFEAVMVCMTDQERMGLRRANSKSQEMKDLMVYLREQ